VGYDTSGSAVYELWSAAARRQIGPLGSAPSTDADYLCHGFLG
jgi:hypothetical protein